MTKKKQRSHLLFSSPPIIIPRELANFVGFKEAAFLQQLQYRLGHSKNIRDGRLWVYKTVAGTAPHSKEQSWLFELRPVINSEPTMKRIIKRMVDSGIVITATYNKSNIDRTLWYTLDYARLDFLWETWETGEGLDSAWGRIITILSLGHGDLSHSVSAIPPEWGQDDPLLPETDDNTVDTNSHFVLPLPENRDPLIELWERTMKSVTPFIADVLKEWGEKYSVEEITHAITTASDKGITNHKYVQAILEGEASKEAKAKAYTPRPEFKYDSIVLDD